VAWLDTRCEFRTDFLLASDQEYKWENQLLPLAPLKDQSRTQCTAPPEAQQTKNSSQACWALWKVYSLDSFAGFLSWRFALVLFCSLPWVLLVGGSRFESLTLAGWGKHLPFLQTQLLWGQDCIPAEGLPCPKPNLGPLHLGDRVEKQL